jgi:hypothetical protein
MDARRDSCTSVAVILLLFAKRFGLSEFTTDRLNDLTTGLGELLAGRNSALLQRADVPTRTPAATDLVNQAIAQVCVDLFRGAGLSASDAWTRTARLFLAQGFRNFSVSKIKSLGRLSGAGASMEPAFEQYQMIKGLVEGMLDAKGAACPPSESVAGSVAKTLVARARHLDLRLVA